MHSVFQVVPVKVLACQSPTAQHIDNWDSMEVNFATLLENCMLANLREANAAASGGGKNLILQGLGIQAFNAMLGRKCVLLL